MLSREGLKYLRKGIVSNVAVSAVAFGIWANTKKFTKYKHYEGKFSTFGGSFKHGTAVTAWSDSCRTVGLGFSTEKYGVSYGSTNYKFLKETTKNARKHINHIYDNVKKLAKKA